MFINFSFLRHQSLGLSCWHESGNLKERVWVSLQRSTSGTAQTALCSCNNRQPLQRRLLSAKAYQGRFLSHCDPSEEIVFTGGLRLNILGCKKTHLRLIWWEMEPAQCPEEKKKKYFYKTASLYDFRPFFLLDDLECIALKVACVYTSTPLLSLQTLNTTCG